MKENNLRLELAGNLRTRARKTKKHVWQRLSDDLRVSRKNRKAVNLRDISRNSNEGARVMVAGKVLGTGNLTHRITIIASEFSQSAREKIKAAGGDSIYLSDFAILPNETCKDVILLG